MKAKRYPQYKCPKNKWDGKSPASNTPDSKATVSGRYCKNNCSMYFNGCKLFKK